MSSSDVGRRLFHCCGREPAPGTPSRRVVAEGTLISPTEFKADNVLAKHDETYMPKEVADALKKQGHWKTEAGYGLAGSSKESPK